MLYYELKFPRKNGVYNTFELVLVPGFLMRACAAHALFRTLVFALLSFSHLATASAILNPNFLCLAWSCVCHDQTQHW